MEGGSGAVLGHEYYRVCIGASTIMLTPDVRHAEWCARRFNMARESGVHTAMNILTEQMGFSEEYAKHLYHMLHEEAFNGGSQGQTLN